jgi:phosphoglucosamine mutase
VEVIKEVENDLAEDGRVLVRYSGTESLCRVMVEGKSENEIEMYAQKIVDVITEKLNL